MQIFLQLLITGIATGCFLILATLGFSLTRRVEGFLNIAHAELLSVSAFSTLILNNYLDWPLLPATILAIVITAFVGLLIGRLVFEPIKKYGSAALLISSVGVTYVIHGAVEVVAGTGTQSLDISLATNYTVAGLHITSHQITVIALAAVASVSLALFLSRTRIGLAIRAMAGNAELATSRGIDVHKTSRATWLLASSLAGLAGSILALTSTLSPDLAFKQILLILAVAILAGFGSLYTVIYAGLIIGIVMKVAIFWIPAGYSPLIAFGVVILVLIVRSEGFAGVSKS